MKEIQPVSIWYNGEIVLVTIFNMTSTTDNLSTQATFFYNLFTNADIQVYNGTLLMEGDDYTTYSSSPDSNNYAYQWGATKLNLTLV